MDVSSALHGPSNPSSIFPIALLISYGSLICYSFWTQCLVNLMVLLTCQLWHRSGKAPVVSHPIGTGWWVSSSPFYRTWSEYPGGSGWDGENIGFGTVWIWVRILAGWYFWFLVSLFLKFMWEYIFSRLPVKIYWNNRSILSPGTWGLIILFLFLPVFLVENAPNAHFMATDY